jgi:hypothetical protein
MREPTRFSGQRDTRAGRKLVRPTIFPARTPPNSKSPAIADGALPRSSRAGYLRVAHMYMLISIPTVTSTIFGAFQAIWLSL